MHSLAATETPEIDSNGELMQHHFKSRIGPGSPSKIGNTLIAVSATTEEPEHEQISAAQLSLDATFVNALYNGLTEAILAVQFGTRTIVHWNKGAEAMFGYTAPEVLGKTTEILYADQDSFEKISQLATPIIREQGAWQTEWEYRRRDGSRFPADVVATMIKGSEGTEFYVIVVRDISARKRTKAALQEQTALLLKIRQRLQAVLDNTTMLIYLVASDATFGFINKRFAKLFHINEAEIPGAPLHAVFDKKTADTLMENNAKVLAAKTTMEFEEIIPHADGLHTYISVKVPLYDESGVLYAVCSISTDITERKRDHEIIQKMNEELEARVVERTAELEATNEQLRQEIVNRRQAEEKLLESERMARIGVTTAKLVHEIANPVQTMITAVEVLEEFLIGKASFSPEIINSTVCDLKAEIGLLLDLVDEFKDLARPRKLEIRPVNLTLLVSEVLILEAPQYAKRGIRIEENFATDLPLIAGDPIKLKQVFLNLFKNAAEAMPHGGTLKLCAYRDEPDLVFEVTDTGVGIPHGINVFELFTTSKPIGTGLGLAIVKDIVSGHRGTISYKSELNHGTTFQLRLPPLQHPR
jgi:PAS domain S-box-containing protein